nr:unnamed protein product [Digitaria exilis]
MVAVDLPPYFLLLPLLFIPFVFLALSRRNYPQQRLRLPPAPWALPAIGHIHHLAGGAPPHRALRDLARHHGPLMMLRFCELTVLVASSPAAAREILKTHDVTFASRPVGPMLELAFQGANGVIFAPYGEGWRQLRKICAVELLSARRVHSFFPVRDHELRRLLRSVAAAARTPVNLTAGLKAFAADSTVRAIIGGRSEHRDAFLRLLEEALKIIPGMTLPDLFPSSRLAMMLSRVPRKVKQRRDGMLAIIDPIIQEHQDRRAAGVDDEDEDLLDVLLRLQEDMDFQEPLTTANIKSVIGDLFGAGSDTTATTLLWAMAELMRNPAVMRKAQDEVRSALAGAGHDKVTEDILAGLHYLRQVIKETLRLHPPAPLLLPRECRSSCQVLGYDVPRGAMVLVNAWAIGRDPAHWDKPEEFVPERFQSSGRDFKGMDFEFIPFGAGRRMCPGMAFGLANVELALVALLWHFDWELPDGMVPEEMDMAEAVALSAPPRSDLVLVAIPRMPVPMD